MTAHHETERSPAPPHTPDEDGRLVVVTGRGAAAVATALQPSLRRAARIEGRLISAMFLDAAEAESDLARRFLRYTAGLALADTLRLSGHDVVVAEDLPTEFVEDYLDFASPTPVNLVRLEDGPEGPDDEEFGPALGLTVDGSDPAAAAEVVLRRLDEARVDTWVGEHDEEE